MEKMTFQVTENTKIRADVFLSSVCDLTRSRLKKLFDDGKITLNNQPIKANKIVGVNDQIEIEIPPLTSLEVQPKDIPIDVIYQDDDVAVINKQQGLTVHAGNGTDDDTLVNALLYKLDKLSGINGVIRPGIVHRIDKNTSGLLVVAKNDNAHLHLAQQIQDKTCKRIYVALLEGVLKTDKGTVRTFIGRNKKDRTKMAVTQDGREAVTDYKVIKRYENYTLCEFSLQTGRTHQIRVHAKYLNHPVVGDPEYGYKNQKFNLNGQLLHAKTLRFIHPTTNKLVEFNAPIPDYFEEVLRKIK